MSLMLRQFEDGGEVASSFVCSSPTQSFYLGGHGLYVIQFGAFVDLFEKRVSQL